MMPSSMTTSSTRTTQDEEEPDAERPAAAVRARRGPGRPRHLDPAARLRAGRPRHAGLRAVGCRDRIPRGRPDGLRQPARAGQGRLRHPGQPGRGGRDLDRRRARRQRAPAPGVRRAQAQRHLGRRPRGDRRRGREVGRQQPGAGRAVRDRAAGAPEPARRARRPAGAPVAALHGRRRPPLVPARDCITGPAAQRPAAARPFEEIFADVVVVRGEHAEPPRKALDIALPEEARQAIEQQMEAEGMPNPFERGPEITEIH